MKIAVKHIFSLLMVPILLMASISWVSENHKCLSDCHEEVKSAELSCCATVSENKIVKNDCCETQNDNHCSDEDDCCVNEIVVLDSKIDEFEVAQNSKVVPTFRPIYLASTFSFKNYQFDNHINAPCFKPKKVGFNHIPIHILSCSFKC